ncbi:multisubunit Na+/H+ antiporter MnhF subunit [Mesorhizobium jarvisii]
MSEDMNPVAPHHLPVFITGPGESDYFFIGTIIFLIVAIMAIGNVYFRLHALPERIAHGTTRLQFQLVSVLTLLALFTHNGVYWVAALILALVPIPDFWTPLASMAGSLAMMADSRVWLAVARATRSSDDALVNGREVEASHGRPSATITEISALKGASAGIAGDGLARGRDTAHSTTNGEGA